MAQQLAEGLKGLGVEFLFESPSNQIFPILPDEVLAKPRGVQAFMFASTYLRVEEENEIRGKGES